MAYIRIIDPADAEGRLKQEFDAAVARAGRVYRIVQIMGLRPAHLKASIELYKAIMHGAGALSRAQREMLAVVVSKTNHCHY